MLDDDDDDDAIITYYANVPLYVQISSDKSS